MRSLYTISLLLLAFSPGIVRSEDSKLDYVRDIVPLVKKYCLRCHDGEDAEAGVSMRDFRTAKDFPARRRHGEKIYSALKSNLMPPADEEQPSEDERKRWVGWLDAQLFAVDCDLGPDPGRVTIRRLNRVEYNNTIRDLLALPHAFRPATAFPSDDVGEGFDNIGDVLSLPPLLLEKYMTAAEQVAEKAILIRNAGNAMKQVLRGDKLQKEGGVRLSGDVHAFYSSGSVKATFNFPRAGEYLVRVQASGDKAAGIPAKMKWTLAGRELAEIAAPSRRDNLKFHERPVRTRSGRQTLTVEFTNDFYVRNKEDRNLYVGAIEVVGPLNVLPSELPESHRRIMTRKPRRDSEWVDAATTNLRPIIQRAFRRPLEDAEITPYASMVLLARERGESFEHGMRVALSAVLVSPHFLFRIERDPEPHDSAKRHAVSDYELASRLSYFLWSSMPDDELFRLAKQGRLHEKDVLLTQVRRMLADSKSRALVENFAGQWLNLRNLSEVSPDPNRFRPFTESVRKAMEQETLLFFEEVVRKDRPIIDLLDGKFTYVNGDLAELYGMKDVRGSRFRRVTLDGLPRAGVLTQPSILTITSNATRTSPVKRGKWILENILGEPPPEPPADVPDLEETRKAEPNASLRKQLEIHRANPNCAVCHRKMDALGFGFENFDAIGRWRTREDGLAIDSSGELPGGANFAGPEELVQIIVQDKQKFARVMATKMLTYALGRGLQYYDRCAVDEITEATVKADYQFSALVAAVVLSDPFLRRRGEGEKDE